jgi:hypothetical protein
MPLRYYVDHDAKNPSFPAILSVPNGVRRTGHIWMISCTTAGEPGGSRVVAGYGVEGIRQFKGIQVVELNDFPAGKVAP